MDLFQTCNRIVIKVGTSTLTHASGHLNLRRIEQLVKILSDFKNSGKEIVLVSSGAVSAGIAKLGLDRRPSSLEEKQALAAVGQSDLMNLYSRCFAGYGHTIAQILMTKDVVSDPTRRAITENTFSTLLRMGCVPIVNENDSVSTDELQNFGGNDILSAYVSLVCHADLLLNLSDIDGLFSSDPRKNPDATLIPRVEEVEDYLSAAGGAGSERGTGGMEAKLRAAQIVTEAGIPMFILNGHNPEVLYDLMDGGHVGTYFVAKRA